MKTAALILVIVSVGASAQEMQAPDFDGLLGGGAAPAVSVGATAAAAKEAPAAEGQDASPIYRAMSEVDVYSELANPDAEDYADVPGVGTLRLGTQLRPGEEVQMIRQNGDWAYVNIPVQNYSGWINRASVATDPSLSRLFPAQRSMEKDEPRDPMRQAFIKETEKFDGTPYKWGGMSKKGVDCSGLVKSSMDSTGLGRSVPRTAADQQKAAKKIEKGSDLQPGDLVFTSKGRGSRISHVVVYIGNGQIREAMQSGTQVQPKSFQSRFGVSPENAVSGNKAGSHTLYFGTFF